MRKALALALISCLILSGCSNKPQDTDVGIDDTPIVDDSQIVESEGITQNKPGYAQDNYDSKVYMEYNSGIMPEDVTLAKPYGYKGNTYSGEGISKEETPEPEINTDLPGIENDNPNVNDEAYDSADDPNINTGEEIVNTPDIEDVGSTNEGYRERLLDELDKEIYNNLYISRMLKLNTANSVDELGGAISADAYLRNTKRLLENIEYFDTGIKKYLTDDENINNSWKELKTILIKWREELVNIETIENFFKSDLSLSSNEITAFEQFKKALDNVN